MFENEKDERIRGIDETTTALSMALAHDFILEVMLTREMLETDPDDAERLARILVERWQRRYGDGLGGDAGRGGKSPEVLRATKAFVDRLARKALRRSADSRRPSDLPEPK